MWHLMLVDALYMLSSMTTSAPNARRPRGFTRRQEIAILGACVLAALAVVLGLFLVVLVPMIDQPTRAERAARAARAAAAHADAASPTPSASPAAPRAQTPPPARPDPTARDAATPF